jgi:hypothetical protein
MKETSMSRAKSGGGATMNKVVETTTGRKAEPKVHGVSVGATSRLGAVVGQGTPHKAIYSQQAYTNPVGTNHNFEMGPGAGRVVMRAGSQSKTPSPTPMGRGRSLFK